MYSLTPASGVRPFRDFCRESFLSMDGVTTPVGLGYLSRVCAGQQQHATLNSCELC